MGVRNARRFAIAIALLSVALGIAHLINIREAPQFSVPVLDEAAYDTQAMGVLAGTWPGKKVFYQDPLYPYFLAFNYKLFGHDYVAPRVFNVLFGAATLLFIFGITLRAFGPGLAALAITLAASFRPLYFDEGQLTKEPLGMLFLAAALYFLIRARASKKISTYLTAGILLGVACLTRANLLVVAACWGCWIFFASKKSEGYFASAKKAAVFCLGIALSISPVTIHNARAGDFVLITSQGGQNFYIGNHMGNLLGTYIPPPFLRSNPLVEESDFAAEAYRNTNLHFTPSKASDYWYSKAWDHILGNKPEFAAKLYRKALLVFNHREISDNLNFYFFQMRFSWVLRLPTPMWGTLSALGLFGFAMLLLGLYRRDKNIKSEVVPILILLPVYALTLVAFYVFSRYRIYLLVAVAPLAAYGIKAIVDILATRKLKKIIFAAAVVSALFYMTHRKLLEPHLEVAYFQTGNCYLKLGKYEEAENEYLEALYLRPDTPAFLGNLAAALHLQGRDKEAIEIYGQTLELDPRNANARIGIGDALVAIDELDRAIYHYQLAALYGANTPEVWIRIGKVYLKLGIMDTALSSFEKAMELDPENAQNRKIIKDALDSVPKKSEP